MQPSNVLRPATYKDGLVVLNHLRPEDKAEVEGMGYHCSMSPSVFWLANMLPISTDEEPARIVDR